MASGNFCIDIGETYIRIADVTRKADRLEVAGLSILPTDRIIFQSDREDILANQGKGIAQTLKENKTRKKNVDIVLPDSLSYNIIVEMPRLNERELLSAIKYQADQFIPMPIEEVGIDVEILEDNETEKKILALICAAPKKTLEKVQKIAEYAGLIPTTIETETSAVSRFLSEMHKSESQNVNQGILFINFGYSSTSLYFYNDSLRLVTHIHNFAVGYKLLVKEIEVNLKTDENGAVEMLSKFGNQQSQVDLQSVLSIVIKNFVLEVQRFMSLLSGRHQLNVKTIYIYNESLRFPAISQLLERFFKIPVKPYDLTALIQSNATTQKYGDRLSYFLGSFGGNLR